jgi:hypothetical protein
VQLAAEGLNNLPQRTHQHVSAPLEARYVGLRDPEPIGQLLLGAGLPESPQFLDERGQPIEPLTLPTPLSAQAAAMCEKPSLRCGIPQEPKHRLPCQCFIAFGILPQD